MGGGSNHLLGRVRGDVLSREKNREKAPPVFPWPNNSYARLSSEDATPLQHRTSCVCCMCFLADVVCCGVNRTYGAQEGAHNLKFVPASVLVLDARSVILGTPQTHLFSPLIGHDGQQISNIPPLKSRPHPGGVWERNSCCASLACLMGCTGGDFTHCQCSSQQNGPSVRAAGWCEIPAGMLER